MPSISRCFDLLRFPLIVLVVLIHADNLDLLVDGQLVDYTYENGWAHAVRYALSQGLARVAVPLMFGMAGYLFFLGFSGTREEWRRKLNSRLRTVLLPYLAWETAHLVARLVQAGPFEGHWGLLDAVLGITRPPLAFHLWFVRDLFVMVCLSPLLYRGLRRFPVALVLATQLLYLLPLWPLPRPGAVSLGYFTLGAALALQGWQGRGVAGRSFRWWLPYMLLTGLDIWGLSHLGMAGDQLAFVRRLTQLLGCGAFLSLGYAISRERSFWVLSLEALAPASFFVYAAHEPLQRFLRSACAQAGLSAWDQGAWSLYFVPAFAACLLCAGVYFLLVRRVPLLKALFTGSR